MRDPGSVSGLNSFEGSETNSARGVINEIYCNVRYSMVIFDSFPFNSLINVRSRDWDEFGISGGELGLVGANWAKEGIPTLI